MLTYLLSLIETDGDKVIFTMMFERYERKALTTSMIVLHNRRDAEDAAVAAWVKVIDRFELAKEYFNKPRSEFEAWLITVVKNTAKDELRKKKKAPIPMEMWDMPSPEDIEAESRFRALTDMIHSMPEQFRDVLEMRIIEGRSFKEIGKAMRCSTSTAQKRFDAAKKELRKRLLK